MDKLVTVKEAADMAHVSISAIYKYTKNGTLPRRKFAGAVRIRKRDVELMIERDFFTQNKEIRHA